MALTRVAMPSPNYTAGRGACRLLVVHTTEGARTIASLGNWFANPANDCSSHAGADDQPATIGVYVKRGDTAWTQAGANQIACSIELCAFAAWDRAEWDRHPAMLANCAAWLAEEAAAFNIPIARLTPTEAQSDGHGVCAHSDLGAWGGGHSDPGNGFPWDSVLAAATGTPPDLPEELDMIAAPCTFDMDDGSQQLFYVDAGGRLVHWYWLAGRNWSSEGLSTGWDPDTSLAWHQSPGGSHQIWGVLADGKRAQCYWSGKAWITQPLA
ncbi:MAG TPA: hypothetical protein VGH66_13950 [Acidimicrobiales bacterium]|jgi:hypothetical protein